MSEWDSREEPSGPAFASGEAKGMDLRGGKLPSLLIERVPSVLVLSVGAPLSPVSRFGLEVVTRQSDRTSHK